MPDQQRPVGWGMSDFKFRTIGPLPPYAEYSSGPDYDDGVLLISPRAQLRMAGRNPLVRLELEGLDPAIRAKAESVITDPTMTREGGLLGISLPGQRHLVWTIHRIERNDDGSVTYHGSPYQFPAPEEGTP